ncbi:MAG: LysM peptidoglycan-binding domain-containing protein [Chitinophagaceae bacterium]|nr:MAG: LysM peptidoglycan-binding domain-containing protein [Chitinophagaceae bacterium]
MLKFKKLSITVITLIFSSSLFAGDLMPVYESVDVKSDTASLAYTTEEFEEESFYVACTLDSMLVNLYKGYKSENQAHFFGFDTSALPHYSDSTLHAWLRQMPVVMPFAFNNRVKRFIELYAYQRRQQVAHMLVLGETYFPIFEEALERKGMPHELKYLPVVESALNNHAVSRVGATGIWQIMQPTGRMLGLTINSVVDERRDPYKATEAALNYLESLHNIYGDWLLALAAYNCGPGNLNRAIRRSGGKRNYWELLPYIPRETRGYVPAFIGAAFVMNYHNKFNIRPVENDYQWMATDTIMIKDRITFSLISEKLGIPKETIEYLNPAYRAKFIPESGNGFPLKLPIEYLASFEANADTLFAMERKAAPVDPVPAVTQAASQRTIVPENSVRLHYTVKEGDNIGFIAEWYDVRAQDIRDWNNIRGNIIRVGQRLTIFVPEGNADKYRGINDMDFAQKRAYLSSKRTNPGVSATIDPEKCDCELYTVRSGDTLWDISRKYPEVSVDDLRRANNLSDSRTLRPGMVLKIKQP